MKQNFLNRSLNPVGRLVLAVCLGLALGSTAFGQTLLYQWNFDNATGTGSSLAVPPVVVDTAAGYFGGNLTVLNGGTSLSTPAGSGVFGAATNTDLGLVNSGFYATAGGGALAGVVGNLSAITNFTVSLWFNLNANATNFSSVNGAQYNPRLFCIDSNYNNTGSADGNELYFGLAQPTGTGQERIQFGVFVPSNQQDGTPFGSFGNGPTGLTNQWIFIAAAYTTNAGGTAQIYVGTTNQLAVLTATMTGVGYFTNGTQKWLSTSNLVEIGNRTKDGARPLMGSIDDVRFYGNALTLAQVQSVQGVFLPPVITAPPTADVVFSNESPHFSVTASGSFPLAYQWMRNSTNLLNGGNISGATSNVLTVAGVSAADLFNNYQVIVTNLAGAVTSSPVSLSFTSTNGAYEAAVLTNNPFALYTFSETGNPGAGNVEAYDSVSGYNGAYGTGGTNDQNGSGALNGASTPPIAGPQATADGLIGFPDNNTALGCVINNYPLDSYVTVPAFNLNNGNGTNVLTITAWINPSGGQNHATGIVFSRGGTTQSGLCYNALATDGNYKLGYNWDNDPTTYNWDSGLEPTPGVWQLVALVISPTNSTIYLVSSTGLQFASQMHTNQIQIFDGITLIGNDSTDTTGKRNFNGSIDEVALFNQAMTPAQISALYESASGVLFAPPPSITGEPSWPSPLYAGMSASATVTNVGGAYFQWRAGLGGVYTNLADGPNISGSGTATLTINSVQSTNALDYIVVITNSFGAVTSAPPATLVITPPGSPQNYQLNLGGTPLVQGNGTNWNTANYWNPGGLAASFTAFSNPGSTYEAVVGSRLRTPLAGYNIFPGTGYEVEIDGDGVYEDSTVNTIAELRIKHTGSNPATNYYGNLVLNGGEVFNGDTGLLVLQGRLQIQNNSVLYSDTAENRSFQIDAWLTGSGNIFYHDANTNVAGIADFNVTGGTNTFTGQWIVDQGVLLGSGANSLGTNNIILGTNGLVAALETLYDVNNTNASLVIGSKSIILLHQNDHFASVTVNGTPLASGTYPFAALNSAYPANFPPLWVQQIGSTFSAASGQIVVGNGGPPKSPRLTGFQVSGSTLSFSATNGTAGGSWLLLQSTNVALPLNQWHTNLTGNFDGSGDLSTNITSPPTNPQEFYLLKVQ